MTDESTANDQSKVNDQSTANDQSMANDGSRVNDQSKVDDQSTSDDAQFARELDNARALLDGNDITAAVVGVVRNGDAVDTTFTQRANSPREEGLQALSLLAAHVRLVANEAGVDHTTVASDAASLAGAVEEVSPDALASAAEESNGPSAESSSEETTGDESGID